MRTWATPPRIGGIGFLCLVLTTGLAGCYPGSVDGLDDRDVVLSFFDVDADFEGYDTYAMPDSIVRIDGRRGGAGTPTLDRQILDAIATEFAALGYTRVAASAVTPPDVLVLVSATAADVPYWASEDWWSDWGWYPGWSNWYAWGSGTSLTYPWAAERPGTQTEGTLLITMSDPSRETAGSQEIAVVWAGALNRLLDGTNSSVVSVFQGLIRQLFDQSPYL